MQGQHGAFQYDCFGGEPTTFQGNVIFKKEKSPYSSKEYICFRRDVKLANGDVIVSNAKLLDAPSENPKQDKDIEIIKQILNSVKPLDLKTN